MADNVLGGVRIEISGDWSRLEVDFKSAEKAAQTAGAKIASSMTVSMQGSSAATDQFSAAIDRLIAAQSRENAALSMSIQRNLAMQGTARATASTIRQVGEESAGAEKKVKGFVGAIPMLGIAAERFVGMVPGLGNLLIKAFPFFGAIALVEGLSRIAGNIGEIAQGWDPVISAEKRATDEAEKFSQAIAKVRKELQDIADTNFGEMFGASALQGFQAANISSQIAELKVQLSMAQSQVGRTRGAGAIAGAAQALLPPGLSDVAGRFAKGARIDTATQTQDVVLLQSQIRRLEELQEQHSRHSAREQDKTNDDAAKKAKQEAEKAAKRDQEGWENRYRLFEEALKQIQAARDRDIADEARYQEAMAEQRQRWAKINLDAKDERLKQAKIDVPLGTQVSGPMATALELGSAGIQTTQMRQAAIAEDARLLNMAQAMNVPLGTQLRMREQILQQQIDLKAAQGQSVSAELQALDALQAQMDRMYQKAAGIAPLLHNLRGIGGQIPGQLGGALAGGIMGGNPGKGIGQEIRGALQGIGQQILGTIFQRAIEQLVVSLGINTLANTVLQALFGVQQASTAGLIASQTANTAALVANTTAVGAQAVTGGVGAAAGIAGSVGSAASGGLLGSVISGAISAAGSLVSAFLIIRAIHGTTAEVRALRKSGGIKSGSGGISGADAEKPAQAGYMSSLAKIFGADAVRVNIVAISPLAFTNGVFGLIGNLFGFADGGRPPLGRPSIVGERGPELFIPDQAGRIMPNGGSGLSFPVASSNGGGITIGSITANGVNNPREFVREVARQLPAYLKSTNPKYSPASR